MNRLYVARSRSRLWCSLPQPDYWTDCVGPEWAGGPVSPGPLVLVVNPVELDLVQDVEVAEVGRPLALPGPDQLDREGGSLD